MSKETETSPLLELQEHKDRLEGIIGSRRNLAERLGRAQDHLLASIERHEVTLSGINEQIIQTEESVVSKAQGYLDQLASARQAMEQVRELVNVGAFSRNVLKSLEREHRRLQAQGADPNIQRGLEILRARSEQEQSVSSGGETQPLAEVQAAVIAPTLLEAVVPTPPAEEKKRVLPKLVIDLLKPQEVQIDGKRITLSPRDMAVLIRLAKTPQGGVSQKQITEIARQAGAKGRYPGSDTMAYLREKLEADPKNPQLLVSSGTNRNLQYRLDAQVEFLGERPESKRAREARQVFVVLLPGGRKLEVEGKITAQAIELLLMTSNEDPISSGGLTTYLYKVDDKRTRKLASSILVRVKKIVEPLGYRLVQITRPREMFRGQGGIYYLERPAEEAEERQKYYWDEPVLESRREALKILLDNPQTSREQIIGILGLTSGRKRQARQLTWPQASRALQNAARFLRIRIDKETAIPEELELWERIKAQTGEVENLATLRKFNLWVHTWFKEGAVTPKEAAEIGREIEGKEKVEVEPFSSAEIAVLAAVLAVEMHLRREIMVKYQIPPVPPGIVRELSEQLTDPLRLTENELFQLRNQALAKMIDIIKNNLIDEVYEQQTSEAVQNFLIYFLDLDPPKTYELLEELLEIPLDRFHQIDVYGHVLRYWEELRYSPETAIEQEVQAAALPQEKTPTEEITTGDVRIIFEAPRSSLRKIEERDPDVRQRVNSLLDQVKSKGIGSSLMNSAQLSLFFPLKERTIGDAIKRGYINPQIVTGKGTINQPRFNTAEIVVLIYLREYLDNNLSSRQKRKLAEELAEIIQEEMTKRTE